MNLRFVSGFSISLVLCRDNEVNTEGSAAALRASGLAMSRNAELSADVFIVVN